MGDMVRSDIGLPGPSGPFAACLDYGEEVYKEVYMGQSAWFTVMGDDRSEREPVAPAAAKWIEEEAPDGSKYWINPITRAATWVNPAAPVITEAPGCIVTTTPDFNSIEVSTKSVIIVRYII